MHFLGHDVSPPDDMGAGLVWSNSSLGFDKVGKLERLVNVFDTGLLRAALGWIIVAVIGEEFRLLVQWPQRLRVLS